MSVHNGCILFGSRVVIPARGQEQLLEDLPTAHPGMGRMKNLAGATYGDRGWIQTLKIRSSHQKYVSFIELHLLLHLCILGSGLSE